MELRILTFNWHESYIHLLAKTGYQFDVVEKWKGGRYGWIREFRPIPSNCRLISEDEAKARLESGSYDRIIAHNISDLLFVNEWPISKVLIFHNKLSTEIALGGNTVNRESYLKEVSQLFDATKNLTLVFISKAKKDDWELDGEIILPGIDHTEYGGYTGNVGKVLRVDNFLMERDIMLGYSIQEKLLSGIPSTLLGLNPNIAGSYVPKDWEELKGFMRSHRVYLNTTLDPYEDGYNLAMLEAMATGMSVVSTANPSSPIEDGMDGYVSSDEIYLRGKIEELLKNRSLAKTLGRKARETVMEKFPLERFIWEWKRILGVSSHLLSLRGEAEAISKDEILHRVYPEQKNKIPHGVYSEPSIEILRFAQNDRRQRATNERLEVSSGEKKRLKILMSYTSNPQTTSAYMEKALRKSHDVITYGPKIDEVILKDWDMEEIRDRVRDHDIPYFTSDIGKVLQRLPGEWVPDLFLWVESGIWYPLEGLKSLPCPTVCYLIDTHLHLEKHLEMAKAFDYVFLAQKEYISRFKKAGIERVFWLPLACDPETHGRKANKNNPPSPPFSKGGLGGFSSGKLYDIGFAGSLIDPRRVDLLNKLKQKFDVYYERCFLERMAEVFSQSKIVFNSSVKDDLNMRVFEAMASGSMLLTDEAKGSGLTELFHDKKHLVIYRDEKELLEFADYYLRHGEERERVAEEGMKEVLDKHAYKHRVKEMIEIINPPESPLTPLCKRGAEGDLKGGMGGFSDYFSQERRDVEAIIPEEAMRILDVGCGEGILGKRLLDKGAKEVVGIEINDEVCEMARDNLTRIICGDIESLEFPFDEGYFDCIVFADILEHLKDPFSTLKRLKKYLADSGVVVASIPNVRYYGVINMLIEGHWRYEDYGILDKTHLRFFTKKEIDALLKDAGFEITGITGNMDPAYNSLTDTLSREIAFGRIYLKGLSPEEIKDLFVIQYLIRAQKAGHDLQRVHDTVSSAIESENLSEAERSLEEYLEFHPADTDILYRHAEVCYKLGLLDKAIESIERLLIFEPDRGDAVELKRIIAGL